MFTLNDLWKIFNILKGEDVSDIAYVMKVLAQSEQAKSNTLFENTIDQFVFNTNDYKRLKRFLVDWYSSLKTLTSLQSKVNDPHILPNAHLDELFRSFGYNYSNQMLSLPSAIYSINETKINLFLDLVNLYKIKGTPRSIVEILSYYGLVNVDLFEFWVEKNTESSVIFRGKPIISSSNNTNDYIVSFNEMIVEDPHWMLTEEQVLQLHSSNKINLPSKSPYFAIQPKYNLTEVNKSIVIISRKIRDQYDEYQATGSISDQTASITNYGTSVSLLELYLSCIYIFNRQYSTGKAADNILYYDGTNTTYADIINEYNYYTETAPSTRDNRTNKILQFLDIFTKTKSGDFLTTTTSAGTILNTINPTLYTYLSSAYIEGETDLLASLLVDLGDWARVHINTSYINISYIILGLVTLLEDIGDIINFFKPYRSRMIDLELLDVDDKLHDSIRIDDNANDIAKDVIYDYITADGIALDSTASEICRSSQCPDSTASSGCWGYRRDTYDCGSYYDIGCAWDEETKKIYDSYYDSVFCFNDGTSSFDFGITYVDSTSGEDSTSISVIYVNSGFCNFDDEGIFDCVSGADSCYIFVEDVIEEGPMGPGI